MVAKDWVLSLRYASGNHISCMTTLHPIASTLDEQYPASCEFEPAHSSFHSPPQALAWTLSAFALLNSHQPQLLRAVTARTKQLLREQQQQQQQQHPSARPVLLPVDVVSLLWAFGVLQHVDMDCLNGLLG